MSEIKKAAEPFRFFTRLNLAEITGTKARDLVELLEGIKSVSGSSIYHHTHRFLQQHIYLSPEPPNDFAYWVTNVLGEARLGERLASIDTTQFSTIRELRDRIAGALSEYLSEDPSAAKRFARRDEEFYFMKSVSFILPTRHQARDLREFAEILKMITVDSIYFHVFEARLRLGKKTNDFALWIETSMGEEDLAKKISRLDPYTRTIDDLRKTLVNMIEKHAG